VSAKQREFRKRAVRVWQSLRATLVSAGELGADEQALLVFLWKRATGRRPMCSALHADELNHISDEGLREARRNLFARGFVTDDVVSYEITERGEIEAERVNEKDGG